MLRMMIRKNHDGGRWAKESGIVLKIEDDIRRFLKEESIYSIRSVRRRST